MPEYKNLPDAQLIFLVAKSDPRAFEILYDRYAEKLFVFTYKRLRLEEECRDIVQDLFINLWERRHSLQIDGEFEGYAFSIAKYKVLAVLNKAMKDRARIDYIVHTILPTAQQIVHPGRLKELEELVNVQVSLLPEKMREVYRLSREENLSTREIAQRLTLSEQTVKNQLSSAVRRLRSGLKEAFLLCFLLGLIL